MTAKNLGDYTQQLSQVKQGSSVKVEGPFGRFLQAPDEKSQIWIAGGIGITPFISKAMDLDGHFPYAVDLWFICRHENELVYVKQLQNLAKQNKDFKLHLHLSGIQGRFSGDALAKATRNMSQKRYFICGPNQMMTSLRSQLVTLGIKPHRIQTEQFSLD